MDSIDNYTANGLNQYSDVGGAAPTYDGNGNTTTDHRGQTYTYDGENVLRSASGLASGIASYDVWADGARRQKSYDGVVSAFYYAGDQEIAEYSGATLTRRYVRLPGSVDEPMLMIDYTLDVACTNTSYATCEVWAHQNRLGSVVATTDSTGAVIEKYTYSSYGVSDDATGFPFRFTGQKLDPETGLYYYKARYYDPEVGRFLQTDPVGYKDQQNLYVYCNNDSINCTDPSGEFLQILAGALIGAAVSAVVNVAQQAITQVATGEGSIGERISNIRIDPNQVAISAAGGAAIGAVLAATANPVAAVAAGSIVTGAVTLGSDVESGAFAKNPQRSLIKAGAAAVIGGITTPLGASLGKGTATLLDDALLGATFEAATVAGISAADALIPRDASSAEPQTSPAAPNPCAAGQETCSP